MEEMSEIQRNGVSALPLHIHSMNQSSQPAAGSPRTPRTPWPRQTTCLITPLASPMWEAVLNVRGYLQEVGHLAKPDPYDAWLPITESRSGNGLYAAFHTINAGIGFQALALPFAFTFLGWTWGILCLTFIFFWQLYTLWLLTQLHESVSGTRHSRYLRIAMAAFGEKWGKCLVLFPTMYLSAGTCTAIIVVGGSSMKHFYQIVCGSICKHPLTSIEWYLVFVCLAWVLAQLPNLNSISGISIIGVITAISYCTLTWILSITKARPTGVSHDPSKPNSDAAQAFGILNSLGIIAFAFRGHNLTLEIQATLPSTSIHPSSVSMWRAVKFAYLIIVICLFPLAIAGFWAYGNLIPASGILKAFYKFHEDDTSRVVIGLLTLLVVINSLSSFQIYAMPVFDNLEFIYVSRKKQPCPRWVRIGLRAFFGSVSFFVSVAIPFLGDLAGLIGGISLPITLAYPCFMWIVFKKPEKYSAMWYINWVLGSLGMILSVLVVTAWVWSTVVIGFKVRFFKAAQ